ncbi:MAG: 5'-methylthioadenosine/adenosylhomocysteine nucleosidase, partial [Ruminococcus sp.]|nr:5'-methylthioadenosine/adenosylhomocysteine nucleosidase [Ruminococcus sp.]
MIGLITAMRCEAAFFESVMTDTHSIKLGASSFTKCKIGDTSVVLSVCGVGKVFAGVCANTMIVDLGCTHIVNIGV